MEKVSVNDKSNNQTIIDLVKLIIAILVIGIHTEPFGFNIWLDRGFGIITRLCVPFFFVASGYFFWVKSHNPINYIKRIAILYFAWSIIYLPFDLVDLSKMSIADILDRFFWSGNEHALWYLCGSIVGFIITYLLTKYLKPSVVLCIGFSVLVIGCLKSTWSPLVEKIFSTEVTDIFGSRNGLFYGFPYISLGMFIATRNSTAFVKKKKMFYGFILSLFCLAIESVIFVVLFKTESTILWISVFPLSYYFFLICKNIKISIKQETLLFCRKMSTLMYVSQYLFLPFLSKYFKYTLLFIIAVSIVAIFSMIIIRLSKYKWLKWLRYLY